MEMRKSPFREILRNGNHNMDYNYEIRTVYQGGSPLKMFGLPYN